VKVVSRNVGPRQVAALRAMLLVRREPEPAVVADRREAGVSLGQIGTPDFMDLHPGSGSLVALEWARCRALDHLAGSVEP
jgi:hypothetical protein